MPTTNIGPCGCCGGDGGGGNPDCDDCIPQAPTAIVLDIKTWPLGATSWGSQFNVCECPGVEGAYSVPVTATTVYRYDGTLIEDLGECTPPGTAATHNYTLEFAARLECYGQGRWTAWVSVDLVQTWVSNGSRVISRSYEWKYDPDGETAFADGAYPCPAHVPGAEDNEGVPNGGYSSGSAASNMCATPYTTGQPTATVEIL